MSPEVYPVAFIIDGFGYPPDIAAYLIDDWPYIRFVDQLVCRRQPRRTGSDYDCRAQP